MTKSKSPVVIPPIIEPPKCKKNLNITVIIYKTKRVFNLYWVQEKTVNDAPVGDNTKTASFWQVVEHSFQIRQTTLYPPKVIYLL